MSELIFLEAEIVENDDTAPVANLVKKGEPTTNEPIEQEYESEVIREEDLTTDISKIPVAKAVDDEIEKESTTDKQITDEIAPDNTINDAVADGPIEETIIDEEPITSIVDEPVVSDEIAEETPEDVVEEQASIEEVASENVEIIEEQPEEIVEDSSTSNQDDNEPIIEEAEITDSIPEEETLNTPFIVEEETYDEVVKEQETNDEIVSENAEVIEEQPEETVENIVDEQIFEESEVVNDEVLNEKEETTPLSLKDSMALAKTNISTSKDNISASKAAICSYLSKYDDVQVNTRENFTSTGLPLADTHYQVKNKKKVCFIYVYELGNGQVFFLVRADKETAKKLGNKHPNIKPSAFPKSPNKDWYTVLLDDSFNSNDDVFELLDTLLGKETVKEEIIESPAPIVEEKPKKKAPAKKEKEPEIAKPVEETEAPIKKTNKKGMVLSVEDKNLQNALHDSKFTVAEEKPAKLISNKKTTDDIWAVASVVKQEEKKSTKPIIRKQKEEKIEEPTPIVEEKPKKKAPAKKEVDQAKNNTKAETTAKNKLEEKNMADVKDDEKILVEADLTLNPNPGKFVIKKTEKGNFVYKLFSFNKRVVAIGAEPYADLSSCKGGIKSVANNADTAPIEDQTLKTIKEEKCPKWIVYQDKKGEFRLRLIASNGNIVATTNDGYTTKAAAIKGIEAIGRAAKGAFVARNDNLW